MSMGSILWIMQYVFTSVVFLIFFHRHLKLRFFCGRVVKEKLCWQCDTNWFCKKSHWSKDQSISCFLRNATLLVKKKRHRFLNPSKPVVQEKCFFPPEVSFGSTSETNAFKKCHLAEWEVFFHSKLTHNQKLFWFLLECVLSNMVVHFFTFWEKVNTIFSLFSRISSWSDVYIRFP